MASYHSHIRYHQARRWYGCSSCSSLPLPNHSPSLDTGHQLLGAYVSDHTSLRTSLLWSSPVLLVTPAPSVEMSMPDSLSFSPLFSCHCFWWFQSWMVSNLTASPFLNLFISSDLFFCHQPPELFLDLVIYNCIPSITCFKHLTYTFPAQALP